MPLQYRALLRTSLHYDFNGFVSFRLNNNKLFLRHIFKEEFQQLLDK